MASWRMALIAAMPKALSEAEGVERAAHGGAPAADEAHAFARAAVAIVGGEPGDGGGLAVAQRAQLGQVGLEDGGGDGSDAGDLLHTGGARFHRLLGGDLRGDGFVAGGDLPLQQREERAALRAQQLLGGVFGAVEFGHARLDELRAAAHQRGGGRE